MVADSYALASPDRRMLLARFWQAFNRSPRRGERLGGPPARLGYRRSGRRSAHGLEVTCGVRCVVGLYGVQVGPMVVRGGCEVVVVGWSGRVGPLRSGRRRRDRWWVVGGVVSIVCYQVLSHAIVCYVSLDFVCAEVGRNWGGPGRCRFLKIFCRLLVVICLCRRHFQN